MVSLSIFLLIETYSGKSKMINILLMVHHPISQMSLKGLLSRIEGVHVVAIPYSKSQETNHEEIITTELFSSDLTFDKINMVLFESNYGTPASEQINIPLLTYLLKAFPKSKLIAYSGTTPSLAKAVAFDDRVCVLHKNNTVEKDAQAIVEHLNVGAHVLPSFARFFDTMHLRDYIIRADSTSLGKKGRSNSSPQLTRKLTEMKQEEPFSVAHQAEKKYTPLYSTGIEQKGDPLGLEPMELDTAKSTSSVLRQGFQMKH
jgi:hypothetical protein